MAQLILISLLSCLLFSKCNGSCSLNINKTQNYHGIKGMFVFGSSVVDNGNNNFIGNSLAKANYLPYGVDFPLGPSGRFTNGKTIVDLLGEKLGLPFFLPAFSDPSTKGSRIVYGVNFASGASGILDDTGSIAGNVTSLNEQIKNFEGITLAELKAQFGCKRKQLVRQYMFVVGSGSNDYSFNYFLSPLTPNNVTLQAFTTNLSVSLSHKIKKLYKLGGRKFVVMGINPLGCSPMVKRVRRETENQKNDVNCNQGLNHAARLFNTNLKSLVDDIKPQMPGSNLVFVDSYKIIMDIIRNPSSQGFTEASKPCCKVATLSEGGNGVLCKRKGRVCNDRNTHVFFDALHSTEAVNSQIVEKAFNSHHNTEVYPTNIQQLLMAKPL